MKPQLQGLKLIDGNYTAIPSRSLENGGLSIFSETLGLELHLENQELRFYDPMTQKKLLSHQESEFARQQAELRAEQASQRADRLAARLRELGIDPEAL